MWFVQTLVATLLVFTFASSAQARPKPHPGSTWGSAGLVLNLGFDPSSTEGSRMNGRITFDCADGEFQDSTIDLNGGFMAFGTYTKGHGGPARPDQISQVKKTRFFGQVTAKNTLLLVVVIEDEAKPIVRELARGVQGPIHRCL